MDRIDNETYRLLAENTVECIWLLDLADMRYTYISPSIMSLRGLTVEEAMNEKVEESLTPESLKKIKRLGKKRLKKFLNGDRSQEVVMSVDGLQQYCKDGTVKDVEISTKFVFNKNTNSVNVIGVTRDITEWKKRETSLADQIADLLETNKVLGTIAHTDELTGVYNRYLFDQKIMEEAERADRYHHPLSLVIFDLDHFKKVNDTCGHDAGDHVLIATAELVGNLIRKTDTFARWGGEEFAILMPDTTLDQALQVAEKLRTALAENLDSCAGPVTASFGVAEKLDGELWQRWFKRADLALYRAKNQGRNCVVCCNEPAIFPIQAVRLKWGTELKCGNKLIDDQHRQLIELANALIDLSLSDMRSEKVVGQLQRLLEHVVSHFAEEEKVLTQAGYPDAELHAEKHKSLIDKAQQLKDRYLIGELKASDILSYLIDEVIVGHLLAEDALFLPYTCR